MSKQAYLTIDESPSPYTDQLTDWLSGREIPALFFCRGDRMEKDIDPIVRAIEKGFTIGNHLYSHTRASKLSFEETIKEIENTENLINKAYKMANVERSGKYIRFPHLDRGMGGWVIDYNSVPEIYRDFVSNLFKDGLRINLDKPSDELIDKKNKIQEWLKDNGFTNPVDDIKFSWYLCSEMSETIDMLYTYSTSDWMLTDRHIGNHKYKNLIDLRKKIDSDLTLKDSKNHHIILMHDDPENILDVNIELILYLQKNDVEFISI